MRTIYKKIVSLIPLYSFIPLIFSVTFNLAVYVGTRLVARGWHHYNIESPLDALIPFWPPSALIYLGCYLFWIVNYILIARQEKKKSASFLQRIFFQG